jgi:hypothetical protein
LSANKFNNKNLGLPLIVEERKGHPEISDFRMENNQLKCKKNRILSSMYYKNETFAVRQAKPGAGG